MGIVDQINSLQKQIDRLKAKVCCIDTSGGGGTTIINNNPLANTVISGGIVTWLQDYDYEVSAAVYNIGGVRYTSPVTDITLAAADPTNDRIDVFVLTTSGTAIALQGTPSVNPQEPNEDIDTQLPVSFAIVSAGTTAPVPTVSDDNIYLENVEWTTSSNSANIVANSTNNPFAGTLDVEGTNVTTGNQIVFTAPSVPNYADYDLLTFKIRSKAGWVKKRLQIQWLSGTTLMGNQVVFGEGTYGFVSTNTATYQTISIPLSAFGTISGSNKLRIRRGGTGTIGFYLDNIRLTTTSILNNPSATDTLSRFGIEDRFGLQDRSVDMQTHSLYVTNNTEVLFERKPDGTTATLAGMYLGTSAFDVVAQMYSGVNSAISISDNGSYISSPSGKKQNFVDNSDFDRYIPLSVNNTFADSAGNITIAGGGGSTRFGFAGEDATAAETRKFDLAFNTLSLVDNIQFTVTSGDGSTPTYPATDFIVADNTTQMVRAITNNNYAGVSVQDVGGIATAIMSATSNALSPEIRVGDGIFIFPGLSGLGAPGVTKMVLPVSTSYADPVSVQSDGTLLKGVRNRLIGIDEYTDNTDAVTNGGLVAGDMYRTGDLLKIVH